MEDDVFSWSYYPDDAGQKQRIAINEDLIYTHSPIGATFKKLLVTYDMIVALHGEDIYAPIYRTSLDEAC